MFGKAVLYATACLGRGERRRDTGKDSVSKVESCFMGPGVAAICIKDAEDREVVPRCRSFAGPTCILNPICRCWCVCFVG